MAYAYRYIDSTVKEFDREVFEKLVDENRNTDVDNISIFINNELSISSSHYFIIFEPEFKHYIIVDSDYNKLEIDNGLISSQGSYKEGSLFDVLKSNLYDLKRDTKIENSKLSRLDSDLVPPFISLIEGGNLQSNIKMVENIVSELETEDNALDAFVENYHEIMNSFAGVPHILFVGNNWN